MPLQSSGAISLNDIHTEVGGTSETQASLNDSDIRSLVSKLSGDENSFDDYYGVSSSPIISGDGFFWWYSTSTSGGVPNPQFTFAAIVVKLGGNVVKGSFTANASNGGP